MEKIKLVACDMDGTLLDDRKEISEENIRAVKALSAKGVHFVIATGRHDSMIKAYLDVLDISTPVISCNGALIRNPLTGELYSSVHLESSQVLDLIALCKKYHADYHIYGKDIVFGETLTNKVYYYDQRNRILPERDRIPLLISRDYKSFVQEQEGMLYKVLVIPPRQEDFPFLKKKIYEETGLDAFQSDATLLDVMQKGITKAKAIEILCRKLGIKQFETAAIGDQLNDLDMIVYAGTGVAVNNAVPEIRQAAVIVTEKCNNHSGVAEALELLPTGA